MAALYYVGLKWILTQKTEESSNYFVDKYFAEFYHNEHGSNHDALKLASLSEIFKAMISQHNQKIWEANYAATIPALKEVDEAFIGQVIDEWLSHDNKFDLPVVKEFLKTVDEESYLKKYLLKKISRDAR